MVDTPAYVVLSSTTKLPPPSVMIWLVRVHNAKRINPTLALYLRKHVSLNGQKTARLVVALGSGYVDFMMSGIEVAEHIHPAAAP